MVRFHENVVSVSVRNLVEFVLRSGDIDNRNTGVSDKEAMQAGRYKEVWEQTTSRRWL